MKTKSYKTWLAVGLLTMAGLTRGVASAADIKICVEGGHPPFSSISPSGEVVGFDVDMANALAKQMGKTPKMVKIDWDGMIPALLAKKCDAIVASMSITAERKKKIDFSEKYYNTPARFAGKKSANLSDSAAALKGKTIGVHQATVLEDFMKKKYPDVKLRSYATQEKANADLLTGRIDAIFADAVPLGYFLKTPAAKDIAAFGKEYYDSAILGDGVGVGVRKEDTALRDEFSKAIKDVRKSGAYAKLNKKYFNFDIYGK